MDIDQTTTVDAAPQEGSANLTIDDLARQLNARRKKSQDSTVTPQGVQAASDQDEDPQTVQDPDPGLEVQENQDGQSQEPTDDADQTSALPPEIAEAIAAANIADDRASAIKSMSGRMFKALRDRDAQAARAAELETKVAELQKAQPQIDVNALMGGQDPRVAQATQAVSAYETAIMRLESNPDGMTLTDEAGKEHVLDAAAVRQLLGEYRTRYVKALNEQSRIQDKVQEERDRLSSQSREQATREYPWINNDKSQEYQLAIAELNHMGPVARLLQSMPQYPLIMGRYIAGLKAERSKLAPVPSPGKTIPPSQRKAPAVASPVSGSASTSSSLEQRLKMAKERFSNNGTMENLAQVKSLERKLAQEQRVRSLK